MVGCLPFPGQGVDSERGDGPDDAMNGNQEGVTATAGYGPRYACTGSLSCKLSCAGPSMLRNAGSPQCGQFESGFHFSSRFKCLEHLAFLLVSEV